MLMSRHTNRILPCGGGECEDRRAKKHQQVHEDQSLTPSHINTKVTMTTMRRTKANSTVGALLVALVFASAGHCNGFAPVVPMPTRVQELKTSRSAHKHQQDDGERSDDDNSGLSFFQQAGRALTTAGLAVSLVVSSTIVAPTATMNPVFADTLPATVSKYDGFAEYAKDNKMEQSDVGCFINKCGDQTKNLFSNPRGIKGVSCLGRCKGEQSCATRCFAEFGSEDLYNWLSCSIEDNECVKVPKNIDNSAEEQGYDTTVKNFDPKSLIGKWYKTDGLNPNYDLFDCQTNTFESTADGASELDMGIFLRIAQPKESGGGFWDNALSEHMVVDAAPENKDLPNPSKRTMHTQGKMYGLTFDENWYIIGESDGSKGIPEFKLVAYKGHTLQGNYEGSFVYAKEARLPEAAIPAVREAAANAGLNFDKFTRIDNTCPAGEALNDSSAGTGTSTTDWIDLVVGEGGVIDWVVPGWRGEYK